MTCSTFSAIATERIVVQKPVETSDNYGGRTVTWATAATCWAQINPVSGRELFAQQATQSRATHRMLIRYRSEFKDITQISDYRVSYDGRLFAINAIRNLDLDMKREGRSFQEFLVEENGADVNG